jgi:tetratricopeptide (TPR) repeat protein
MLQQNPNNLDIMEWLAFKLYSVSNYEEAEQLFRNLIANDHRAGVQHFYLGNLLAKTGREQEAVKCWRQTVALIPKDVKAKKAQARIEKMAASNPNV